MKFKKAIASVLAVTAACATMGFSSCGDKDTLIVYTEAGFAPFEYMSKGKIVGVDVDIMNLVGKKLDKKVKFENVDFGIIVDSVSDGKLCNVGAAGISITPEREEKVDFSLPYYTANLYVIYRTKDAEVYTSNMSDGETGVYWEAMSEATIAVQNGTTADLFLSDELAGGVLADSNASKVGFTALATAVADVEKNVEADVLIIDELPAQQLIAGKSELACAPLYYKGDEGEEDEPAVDTYAICVTKGETEILNAINAVLTELGEDGIQELVSKHLGL